MGIYAEKGPPALLNLLAESYAEFLSEDPENAEQLAYRAANHAGWYRDGSGGWTRLGPDLRSKINVRRGVKQDNGKFVVRDVDVFYPNAVKGAESQYDADHIGYIVDNTNRAVNGGGQRPGLIREHTLPERKALGIPTPAFGAGINFRPSPRGKAWVRCDLVDVEPDVYNEWKQGRWTGLSAGFAQDAEGLNKRFGHIALLGADMQALSKLPRTEVYSSQTDSFAGEQLFFSADPVLMKDLTMPMTKEEIAAHKQCYSALTAAFAAAEAGEPDAEAKIAAARAAHDKLSGKGKSGGDDDDSGKSDDGTDDDNQNAAATNDEGRTGTVNPDDNDLDSDLACEPTMGGKGTEAQTGFAAEMDELRSEIKIQRKVNAALLGKHLLTEFSSFCDEAARKGHQFDAETSINLFKKVATDPIAVAGLKAMIMKSPKSALTAGNGAPTFAANTAGSSDAGHQARTQQNNQPNASDDAKALAILNKLYPQLNFNAEHLNLGSTLSAQSENQF